MDVAHDATARLLDRGLGDLPVDRDLGGRGRRDEAVALRLADDRARGGALPAPDHHARAEPDEHERVATVLGTSHDRALDRACVLLHIDIRMIGM